MSVLVEPAILEPDTEPALDWGAPTGSRSAWPGLLLGSLSFGGSGTRELSARASLSDLCLCLWDDGEVERLDAELLADLLEKIDCTEDADETDGVFW